LIKQSKILTWFISSFDATVVSLSSRCCGIQIDDQRANYCQAYGSHPGILQMSRFVWCAYDSVHCQSTHQRTCSERWTQMHLQDFRKLNGPSSKCRRSKQSPATRSDTGFNCHSWCSRLLWGMSLIHLCGLTR
jgi:hypothetical protein